MSAALPSSIGAVLLSSIGVVSSVVSAALPSSIGVVSGVLPSNIGAVLPSSIGVVLPCSAGVAGVVLLSSIGVVRNDIVLSLVVVNLVFDTGVGGVGGVTISSVLLLLCLADLLGFFVCVSVVACAVVVELDCGGGPVFLVGEEEEAEASIDLV